MPPKSAKSRHYPLSLQNSVKFCKDFNRDRILFTPTLLARWYVLTSLHTAANESYSVQPCLPLAATIGPARVFNRPGVAGAFLQTAL